jgi:hypothetical protein
MAALRRSAVLSCVAMLTARAVMAQAPLPLPEPQPGRVFCGQSVTYRLADPSSIPEPYRRFLGPWSDAAWDANTCAALVVTEVQPDGTASIIYVYGPLGSSTRVPGGVLYGTGIIRDDELRFQNSDGTQFAFRAAIADLAGQMAKPNGQTYRSEFKKTF